MTKEQQKEKAYEEYLAIQEPASKYLTIDEPVWKEYLAIIEPAWKEYLVKCEAINEQGKDIKVINGKRYKLID